MLQKHALEPNTTPTNTTNTTNNNTINNAAGRNFVRAALLGLMATFSGVLLFSAPEYLSQALKIALPEALMMPGVQVSLKVAGAALANWAMTSYFY